MQSASKGIGPASRCKATLSVDHKNFLVKVDSRPQVFPQFFMKTSNQIFVYYLHDKIPQDIIIIHTSFLVNNYYGSHQFSTINLAWVENQCGTQY
jgi:hypothetical protein